MTPSLKRVVKWVSVLTFFYVLLCIYMWSTQRQQIFLPSSFLQTSPARDGLRYQDVYIPSGTGAERGVLHGWWIPAQQADAPTLLYLHGNMNNMSANADHARRLHSLGYNLLLIDYRGYGKSTGGKPSEAKVYEDAEAAWNHLMQHPNLLQQSEAAPQRILIYGHSLGGAIAIDLAVRHPEAAGLIVESTFTSMNALVVLEYPLLPIRLILNQYFDSIEKIGNLKIPVLLIHGTGDSKVPYQMSQQLFEKALPQKYLKLIEGGEHNNTSAMAWPEYREAVTSFVQKHTR